jgi:dolichol-phosphate mannosyltransferase
MSTLKINRLFFLIPVFNEPGILELLVKINGIEICQRATQSVVILIDDGSAIPVKIDTKFANIEIVILRQSSNVGPGAAFRLGIDFLPLNLTEEDYVLTLEGDGTSDLGIIPRMFVRINEPFSNHDVVLASPYMHGGGLQSVTLVRRILSSAANEITRVVLDLRGIWTLSSFFRLYRGSSLDKARIHFGNNLITSDGFDAVVEILWKLKRLNLSFSEIPTLVSQEGRVGKSKMKITRTIKGYLALWILSHRLKS